MSQNIIAFEKIHAVPACNNKYGKTVRWGWEIDHIKPASLGGTDDLSNLQPLQWENNRYKSDDYPQWNCKIKI